jgi:hypothetical protein
MTPVRYLGLSSAWVVLPSSNWLVKVVLPEPIGAGFLIQCIVLTEIDSHPPTPESTHRIYSSAMMDGYDEVFAAFRGRGRAPSFELVCFNRFQVGQYPGFVLASGDIDNLNTIL